MTKLSINLNKIALLRNSRGRNTPDLLRFARRCLALGVHGITVHPRPDERHARYTDVLELVKVVREFPGAEFNVEGNPIPRFMDLVHEAQPDQVTLVPDTEDQLTSDHGWDAISERVKLEHIVDSFKQAKIRTSLFLDPVPSQVDAASLIGADRIELYTESYASAHGLANQEAVLAKFEQAGLRAQQKGLGVNAGHDLNLRNLELFLLRVPRVLEVSIGHAVVCECLELGLERTLTSYLELVAKTPAASG